MSTPVITKSNSSYGRLIPLIALGIACLVPFLFAINGSLRTSGELAGDPLGLAFDGSFQNYAEIAASDSFWRTLGNSVVIAILTVMFVLIAGTLSAFAIARFQFPFKEKFYGFFTLGLLFPAAVAILPLYMMIRQLGLLDSMLGVALPQAAFALPVTVVILRPFFQAVPREIEEAASMDGASSLRFFVQIMLPVCVPALITVAILAFVQSWNGYILPLLVLTSQDSWTLPLGLSQFSGSYSFDTARVLAYTVMAMIPTILAYAVAERHIVQGLTAGAVKG